MKQKKQILNFLIIFIIVGIIFSFTAVISGCSTQGGLKTQDITTVPQTIDSTQQNSKTINVKIQNFAFDPATIEIKKGDIVSWTNEDSAPHTVTVKDDFDSGKLTNGQSYSYKFEETEEVDYTCSFHPSMKGKVIVR